MTCTKYVIFPTFKPYETVAETQGNSHVTKVINSPPMDRKEKGIFESCNEKLHICNFAYHKHQ